MIMAQVPPDGVHFAAGSISGELSSEFITVCMKASSRQSCFPSPFQSILTPLFSELHYSQPGSKKIQVSLFLKVVQTHTPLFWFEFH